MRPDDPRYLLLLSEIHIYLFGNYTLGSFFLSAIENTPNLSTSHAFAAFKIRRKMIDEQEEINLDLSTFREYEKVIIYEELFQSIICDVRNLAEKALDF